MLRLNLHAISHVSSRGKNCGAAHRRVQLCRRFTGCIHILQAHARATMRATCVPPCRVARLGGDSAPDIGRGAPGAPPCARDMSSGGRARGAGVRSYWSAASRALLPRAGRGRWGPAGGAASHGAGAARPRHPVPRLDWGDAFYLRGTAWGCTIAYMARGRAPCHPRSVHAR